MQTAANLKFQTIWETTKDAENKCEARDTELEPRVGTS